MASFLRSPPFLFLRTISVPLLLFALSSAADSEDFFLQCLSDHPNPSSPLSSAVYSRTSPGFPSALQAYIRNSRLNTSATPKPRVVVAPRTESDVAAAVVCAGKSGINIIPRSGGHDYEGASYVSDERPFAVLDMFNFRTIAVDAASRSAWVQAGATLGELYYAIWNSSRSSPVPYGFPAGLCPTMGVGGHISGGGYGNMLRKFGLAVDNLLDAVVVDAGGRILDRRAMGEDLFWAVSGGGAGSFGVLLAYRIRLVPVPKTVTVFRIEKTLAENATGLVYDYQLMANKTAEELFVRLLIQPITDKTKAKTKTIRATFIAQFLGGADELVRVMNADFPSLGLKRENCTEMSWIRSVLYWADFEIDSPIEALLNRTPDSVTFLKRKSDYIETPISIPNLDKLWKKMIELGKTGLVFNPYGGQMGEISPAATPVPHRAGNLFKIQYSVNWGAKEGGEAATGGFLKQVRDLYDYTAPLASRNPRRAYLNYRDLDIGTNRDGKASVEEGSVYGRKYFGDNYERLVKVKKTVDPTNVFRNLQSIPAAAAAGPGGGGRRAL